VRSNAVLQGLRRYGNAVLDRAKSTKASYIEKPELIQPVEKKGERVSFIALIIVGPKSIGPTQTAKRNENSMLNHRFAMAPMMDWTDRAEKAKHNQNLSMVAVSHAVPNAVLTIFK
jgi:hypothetical protein